MANMSNQTPPGMTGTPSNTPKKIPKGPLMPARTNKHNTPTGAGSMSRGKQGTGNA